MNFENISYDQFRLLRVLVIEKLTFFIPILIFQLDTNLIHTVKESITKVLAKDKLGNNFVPLW